MKNDQNTVQVTMNLPQRDLTELLKYANENERSLEQQVAELIHQYHAKFINMRDRIDMLECLVTALLHEVQEKGRSDHRIPVAQLLEKGMREMTKEDVLAFSRVEDAEEERWLMRWLETREPLIADLRVLEGALRGRTIKHVSGVVDERHRKVGVSFWTEDGLDVTLQAVDLDFAEESGYSAALKQAAAGWKSSAKLVWHILLPPDMSSVDDEP